MEPRMLSWNLKNQWVIVRFDGNVPSSHTKILDDYRLLSIKPTLNYIRERGGKIILLTHRGPHGQKKADLSNKHLVNWFNNQNLPTLFCPTIHSIAAFKKHASILLLENLRFFKGEKTKNIRFAQSLARMATYYINDAFASMHRQDTSLTTLAEQFPLNKRSYGFLTQKELTALSPICSKNNTTLILLGGAKAATKIPLIEAMLNLNHTVAVLPALSSTFEVARGNSVGRSLIDTHLVPVCKKFIDRAAKTNKNLLIPLDYQIAKKTSTKTLYTVDINHVSKDAYIIAVGPKTITKIASLMTTSSTIFFNGIMGFLENLKH